MRVKYQLYLSPPMINIDVRKQEIKENYPHLIRCNRDIIITKVKYGYFSIKFMHNITDNLIKKSIKTYFHK